MGLLSCSGPPSRPVFALVVAYMGMKVVSGGWLYSPVQLGNHPKSLIPGYSGLATFHRSLPSPFVIHSSDTKRGRAYCSPSYSSIPYGVRIEYAMRVPSGDQRKSYPALSSTSFLLFCPSASAIQSCVEMAEYSRVGLSEGVTSS